MFGPGAAMALTTWLSRSRSLSSSTRSGIRIDRQGQEGLGLEPLAELFRQEGHLRCVPHRLITSVPILVSGLELLGPGLLAAGRPRGPDGRLSPPGRPDGPAR